MEEEIFKKASTPTLLDWANFSRSLSGSPLSDIAKLKRIKKEDLIKNFNWLLHYTKTGTLDSRSYKIKNKKIELIETQVKLSSTEHVEIMLFAIIVSLLNYIRFYYPQTKKHKALLLKKAESLLPLEYISVAKMAFDLKEKIRQNDKELSRNELNILKEKTINFVEFLFKKINES